MELDSTQCSSTKIYFTFASLQVEKKFNIISAGKMKPMMLFMKSSLESLGAVLFSQLCSGKSLWLTNYTNPITYFISGRPKSRGSVMIQSSDFNVAPKIRLNYFQDPNDLKTVIEGLKFSRMLLVRIIKLHFETIF